MATRKRKTGFYWHVHHDVLCEWCYDYDERVAYIKADKPANERKTRLRLFKPVRGKLPVRVAKAEAACDKALAACDKAWAAYGKVLASCAKELEALHAVECGCKEWKGTEIVFGGDEAAS